jgi:hypothetical protein
MPVEAQWHRVRTPLSGRDKRVLGGMTALAAIAAAVGGIALSSGSGSGSNAGCVVVNVPSTMGGATLRQCGPAARTFCRDSGKGDETIAAACRRQGYAAELRP